MSTSTSYDDPTNHWWLYIAMFATFVIFATKNALITILIMYTCHGSCKLFFLVADATSTG
jgi:hypothetical protein